MMVMKTTKSKSYHSNLDELLCETTNTTPPAPPPFMTSTSLPTGQRDSVESLLLDAFYENLLRKNAQSLSKVSDEEEKATLHFDVTKLAAISTSSYSPPGRCSTVTKKRTEQTTKQKPTTVVETLQKSPAKTKKLKNSNQLSR